MTDLIKFAEIPSARYPDLAFIGCEIEGERYVVGCYVFGDRASTVSDVLFHAEAKRLAKRAAAEANALDALMTVRAASDFNAEVFGSDDEDDERKILARVTGELAAALGAENAFQSASWFARGLNVEGFDELFYAFRDRWRPSISVTMEMAHQAAQTREESFFTRRKGYREEAEELKAHPAWSVTGFVAAGPRP
jgi:hypothetical protein